MHRDRGNNETQFTETGKRPEQCSTAERPLAAQPTLALAAP
jgi:hypothetical protein